MNNLKYANGVRPNITEGGIGILISFPFHTDLREAILSQHDKALVAWKTNPQSHGDQLLHGSHNERSVRRITIPLPLRPLLSVVKLSSKINEGTFKYMHNPKL